MIPAKVYIYKKYSKLEKLIKLPSFFDIANRHTLILVSLHYDSFLIKAKRTIYKGNQKQNIARPIWSDFEGEK